MIDRRWYQRPRPFWQWVLHTVAWIVLISFLALMIGSSILTLLQVVGGAS